MTVKHKWTYFIDASTANTGITMLRSDKKKVVVTDLNFSDCGKYGKDMNKAEKHVKKLKKIKEKLDCFIKKYPPEETIYMEGIFIQKSFLNSSEVLLKFHGFLIMYFIDHEFIYMPPKTIKKEIAGNGNATKEKIREILEEKYKVKFKNCDESDSFAVFECWMKTQVEMIDRKIIEFK